jgi:hypothetical protein
MASEIIVIEKNGPRGIEQVSFKFEKSNIELITNSNFIYPYSKTAKLGLFKKSPDSQSNKILARIKELKFSAKKSAELLGKLKLKNKSLDDGIKIKISNIPVNREAPYWNEIYRHAQKLLVSKNWEKSKGVIHTKSELEKKSLCKTYFDKTHCLDKTWGNVYFWKAK